MKRKPGNLLPLVLLGLAMGVLSIGLVATFVIIGERSPQSDEIAVAVVHPLQGEANSWWVPKDAVTGAVGHRGPFVARVRFLRAERLSVEILQTADDRVLVRNGKLKRDDPLILPPGEIPDGQAISVTAGLDDEQLIRMTLEAGIAAAMAEDLNESLRFLSASYHDASRLDVGLWRGLLKRAFHEFDDPRIEMSQPPQIGVEGKKAKVLAKIKVEAAYGGRRNYLIGDKDIPDEVVVLMEKSMGGWKISGIQGLNPLGLGERFLLLLGAEAGLSLSPDEAQEKKQACMPCRRRMAERFGPEP